MDFGQAGVNLLDDGTLVLGGFGLEEGHKRVGQGYHADVVDGDLVLDLGDIHGVRLAEVHDVLDAGVQNDAVDVGMGFGDAVI